MKLETKTEHLEKITAYLDRAALERCVIEAVAKEAKVNLRRRDLSTKIEFRDATEGSPAYRVGQTAFVTITIDHAAGAVATEEPSP